MLLGIRRYHILHDTGNLSLVVLDDSIQIWKSLENQHKRVSEINLVISPKYSKQSEILESDMIGDKLIILTSEMWLTTIEFKYSKLFITHRVKLLDSKPSSISYANESLRWFSKN